MKYVNQSKTILAITMLIIGISWTSNIFMLKDLQKDYNRAIMIIEDAGLDDVKLTSPDKEVDHDGAEVAQVTSSVEGMPQGYEVHKKLTAHLTAYNTVEAQTDSTPCISASNKNICGRDDVIALNGYKFGTKVMIDGKVYTVEDRKASRYDSTWIDISFDKDIDGAINFGKRDKEVTILKKQ